jgi:HK97 gp10 family phage protein
MNRKAIHDATIFRQRLRAIKARMGYASARGLHAGAEILADAVRRECPVDSGFLRAHVRVTQELRPGGGVEYFVGFGEQDFVGKTFYAAMIEYGTSRMPANPFMLRAIQTSAGAVRAAVTSYLVRAA